MSSMIVLANDEGEMYAICQRSTENLADSSNGQTVTRREIGTCKIII